MRVNVLKKILYFIAFLSIIILSCFSQVLSDNEKIKIFYKYDEMFFFGHKEKGYNVEVGAVDEITDINNITSKYQSICKEYLDQFNIFINKNIELLKEFYSIIEKTETLKRNKQDIYNDLKEKLQNILLTSLPNAIRCMFSVFDIQYIEVAVKLDKNTYANTLDLDLNIIDNVYWTAYYMGGQPTKLPRNKVIDEQGAIKYPEWFYESNMKIRVVKQIRDKDGKYYGEIYADYYKLDQYDKLFDKDGNPKKTNDKNLN